MSDLKSQLDSRGIDWKQIGPCLLINGDCLEVLPLLEPGSVDAVVTDPPYGINTKSDGSAKLNPWSDLCNSAFWYSAWLKETRRVLSWTGMAWSFLNWRSLVTFQKASCDIQWPIESLLVWDKEWIGPGGRRGLRPSYELIALWCSYDGGIADRGIPDIRRCLWSSQKPHGHPAEKPEALTRWLLTISGDGAVGDWFMGSGTVSESCAILGRRFVGIEQNTKWYEDSCKRTERAWQEKRSELKFPEPPVEKQLELIA